MVGRQLALKTLLTLQQDSVNYDTHSSALPSNNRSDCRGETRSPREK